MHRSFAGYVRFLPLAIVLAGAGVIRAQTPDPSPEAAPAPTTAEADQQPAPATDTLPDPPSPLPPTHGRTDSEACPGGHPGPGQHHAGADGWSHFPTSINGILSLYEALTNKRLIRDSALAQAAPHHRGAGQVPAARRSASSRRRFCSTATLLCRWTTKRANPGPLEVRPLRGIPIYSSPYMLPDSEQVVSYFMKLNYLAPQEAAQLFQTVISPPKPFTSFTPVPNVQAVLITENVPVIHKLIALQAMVDVPPAQVMTEFVTLKRADAEKVVEVLQGLIDQRDEAAAKAAGQPGQPQTDAQGQVIKPRSRPREAASSNPISSSVKPSSSPIPHQPHPGRHASVNFPTSRS